MVSHPNLLWKNFYQIFDINVVDVMISIRNRIMNKCVQRQVDDVNYQHYFI